MPTPAVSWAFSHDALSSLSESSLVPLQLWSILWFLTRFLLNHDYVHVAVYDWAVENSYVDGISRVIEWMNLICILRHLPVRIWGEDCPSNGIQCLWTSGCLRGLMMVEPGGEMRHGINAMNLALWSELNDSCVVGPILVIHSFIHFKHLYSASSSGATQRRSQPQHDQIKPP